MNKKSILAVTLIAAAFILAGCVGGSYTQPQPNPDVNHNLELTNSILSKIDQQSNTFTPEEEEFIQNLTTKVETNSVFTSKEVKILLAYFGVLNPQKLLPERTSFSAPLPNVDMAIVSMEDNSVEVAFRNNKGVAITLPLTGTVSPQSGTTCNNPVVSGIYNNEPIVAGVTQIPNGGGFILKWDCDNLGSLPSTETIFNADLSFQYTNVETGQLLTETGTVSVKYVSTESPTAYMPTSCLVSSGFGCIKAPKISTDTVIFSIENGMGYSVTLETSKITVDNIPCPGSSNAAICPAGDTTCSSLNQAIADGDQATIILKGCNIPSKGIGGTVRISYTANTGNTEVLTARISGKPLN